MTAEAVQFPADAVHRHASTVDGVADAVAHARAAVHELSMDTQAYGQLCQFLPELLSPIFSLAVDALDDNGVALRETADSLRTVAAASTATDASAGRRVQAAGGPLLDLPL